MGCERELYREITLQEVLDAREDRAARQRALLQQYGTPLISFTMNIPGPKKNSPLIRRSFLWGCRLLRRQLLRLKAQVLWEEEICRATGNEAIFVVAADAPELKRMSCMLEDETPLGRLFDMDVLDPEGRKLDREELGLPPRACLICGGPARACARSRAHPVDQLQEATQGLLEAGVRQLRREEIARQACRALLYEVCTTPKPGLVDMAGSGSHRDMDIFTFMTSTAALWPYFAQCAGIGMAGGEPEQVFDLLRRPGMLAEGAMLEATGGINTHKGAIFSLGVLCAALGQLPEEEWSDAPRVLELCASMTRGLVERELAGLEPSQARTAGQRLYLEHGITGVRGQMEQGLPAVAHTGLPTLERLTARGYSLNEAGCAAMLAILAETVDTNLVARSDPAAQQEVSCRLRALLEREECPPRSVLEELDREFAERNLSPGGSADLLAISYLLYFLREERR